MSLQTILDNTTKFIVSEGKRIVSNNSKFSVFVKDDGVDVSTNIDQEIEKNFFTFIKRNYPEHGFFGEENSKLRNIKEYTWYVDPIDGTKWFQNHIPLWTMSFALVKKGEFLPELGIVYNAVSDQLYTASRGGPCIP